MIAKGAPAPDFTLPRDGGGMLTLSGFQPKKVVLYFYPQDDTPGCTIEANDFTRLASDFAAAETVVIGISKDSVASHDKFCRKYGLGIMLASDEDGKVCETYGVWLQKKMFGKAYMGIERTTFLIDGNGTVARVWGKVKVAGHAQQVLDEALTL